MVRKGRSKMAETQKAARSAAAPQEAEVSLLDKIVEEGRFGKEPAALERGKDIIKQFVTQILQGEVTVSKDTEAMINARIAQIDHLIALQLNEVMHHPQFQKLEGTWRGLKYTVDNSELTQNQVIDLRDSRVDHRLGVFRD